MDYYGAFGVVIWFGQIIGCALVAGCVTLLVIELLRR